MTGVEPVRTVLETVVLPLDDNAELTTQSSVSVGAAGFEPAISCPPDRRSCQAEPRPDTDA